MGAVRHRFNVEEYRKMGEAGVFHEDDRIELVDGEVVEMAAIGKRHVESVMRLNQLLSRWTFDSPEDLALFVSVQNPLTVTSDDEPQPDLVLVRRSRESEGIPTPREALLVVEVAYTSLDYDRNTKLPLYANAGIPEAWLVDLTADVIEAHSEPGPEGYGRVACFGRGERAVSVTLPDLAFEASEALPPER